MKFRITVIALTIFNLGVASSQVKDTLYGSVKSLKSKLIFQDSVIQNQKLFATEDEYGHHGFNSNDFTESRFKDWWYNTAVVHYINFEKKYSREGLLKNEKWFYKDNSIVREYAYYHDTLGNLIQIKRSYGKLEGFKINQYTYDDKNRIVTSLESWIEGEDLDDANYNFQMYKYDDNDNLITRRIFLSDGRFLDNAYRYDSENNLIEEFRCYPSKDKSEDDELKSLEMFPDSSIILAKTYTHKDGKLESFVDYDKNNFDKQLYVYKTETYAYEDDLMIEKLTSYSNSKRLCIYKYDAKGRNILESCKDVDSKEWRYESRFKYDNHNQIIEMAYQEGSTTGTIHFAVTYDRYNNWIKQDKIVNGKHLYTWRRDIEYWD